MTFRRSAAALLCFLSVIETGLGSVRIPPNDARIQLLGRFDQSTAGEAAFSWSGSTIRFQLKSRQAKVTLAGASVRYGLRLNGADSGIWQGKKDSTSFEINVPPAIPMPVIVEVIRLNQPLFGESRFAGLELAADADLVPPPGKPERWIEFIGDSITAGHGNEAPNQNIPLETATENVTRAYPFLTARALGARPLVEAWSGIRLTKGSSNTPTLPDRWGRALPDRSNSKWNDSIQPAVVVINLGTNDFLPKPPDEAVWTKDYREFLARVRSSYPKAHIFCTNGPMLNGPAMASLKLWTDALVKSLNDDRIHTLYFGGQRMEDGIGGQWHPSLRTHAIMAAKLSAAIAEKTGWSATSVEIPPVTQATR